MEKSLKFMAIIGLNRVYLKRKFASDKIYEGYSILLVILIVNV